MYIPDLPAAETSNESLENTIRQCLKLKHKQDVLQIQCYTSLGVGIIHLESAEDKHQLLRVIEKIIIDPSRNVTISLVDQLELVSYVVIRTNETKDLPLDSTLQGECGANMRASIDSFSKYFPRSYCFFEGISGDDVEERIFNR